MTIPQLKNDASPNPIAYLKSTNTSSATAPKKKPNSSPKHAPQASPYPSSMISTKKMALSLWNISMENESKTS
jgi:hypothetical protein